MQISNKIENFDEISSSTVHIHYKIKFLFPPGLDSTWCRKILGMIGGNVKNNRIKSKELRNRIMGKFWSIMCVSLPSRQLRWQTAELWNIFIEQKGVPGNHEGYLVQVKNDHYCHAPSPPVINSSQSLDVSHRVACVEEGCVKSVQTRTS